MKIKKSVHEITEFVNTHLMHEKWFKLLIALLIIWIVINVVEKGLSKAFVQNRFIGEKKEETLKSVILSILKYTSAFGFIFYAMSLYVEDFSKILAGVGFAGLVIGFGAQSIIKDVLAGIFFIGEKQLHKGDFIRINGKYTGTVEEVGLRVVKVREWSGKLLTIPNGEVKEVQNYNMEKMRIIEKVTTSFYQDPEIVFQTLDKVCEELNRNHRNWLKKDEKDQPVEIFQVYGLTSLNESHRGYEFAVVGLVHDSHYWEANKIVRREIAKSMYQNKIKMAEQHVRFVTKSPSKE